MNYSAGLVLEQSLLGVWNERDAGRRQAAIERLYAPTICFFEQDAVFEGYVAVSTCIGKLLGQWPAHFYVSI